MLVKPENKMLKLNFKAISKRITILFVKFLTLLIKTFIKLWRFFVKLCKQKIAVGYLFFIVSILIYLSINIYKIKDQEARKAEEYYKKISQQIMRLEIIK